VVGLVASAGLGVMANILIVTILRYPQIVGGVDMMVSNLVTHLKRRHHVCVFVPGGWEQSSLSRQVVDGVPVYSIRLRMPVDRRRPLSGLFGWLADFPRILFKLRSMVRAEGIDLVHAQMGLEHQMYWRVLRWLGGPPYVITVHGSDVVGCFALATSEKAMVQFALSGAAKVNAVSRWLATQAEEVFPQCAPISWVYNGLDFQTLQDLPGQWETSFPEPLPIRYAVMVGSFDPYKGHDLALRAWGKLKGLDPGLHLVLVGDGDLRNFYVSLILELGCERSVHLIGEVPHDDVVRLIAGAEFMVFPSRNEGLGYVILEAGAVGVPVICTRIPVFEEIIEDGSNGLLVPLDQPDELVAAALRLTRDQALRSRLGACLREQVEARFSAHAMTASYEALYESAISARRRGGR